MKHDRIAFCGILFMLGLHTGVVVSAAGRAQDVPTALTWIALEIIALGLLSLRRGKQPKF